MSKYIKEYNHPFLKFESGNVVRIINIDDISDIYYWTSGRAFIYFKSGSEREINIDTAREIDDFIMNRGKRLPKQQKFTETDPDTLHENQTLYEWLNEEGQA